MLPISLRRVRVKKKTQHNTDHKKFPIINLITKRRANQIAAGNTRRPVQQRNA